MEKVKVIIEEGVNEVLLKKLWDVLEREATLEINNIEKVVKVAIEHNITSGGLSFNSAEHIIKYVKEDDVAEFYFNEVDKHFGSEIGKDGKHIYQYWIVTLWLHLLEKQCEKHNLILDAEHYDIRWCC